MGSAAPKPIDIHAMVDKIFDDRVTFHNGSAKPWPGISLHWVGGQSAGLQVVRVKTKRGWVVIGSDASHFYANFEQMRAYATVYNVGDMLEGFSTVKRLASSPRHVIPGHDPLVLRRYPAPKPELKGIAARLDVEPTT